MILVYSTAHGAVLLRSSLSRTALYSVSVNLGKEGSAPLDKTPIAMASQACAGLWHRRMRHISSKTFVILRHSNGNGEDYNGQVFPCHICSMETRTRQPASKQDQLQSQPTFLVGVFNDLTELSRLLRLENLTTYATFRANTARWKEVCLLNAKDDAIDIFSALYRI